MAGINCTSYGIFSNVEPTADMYNRNRDCFPVTREDDPGRAWGPSPVWQQLMMMDQRREDGLARREVELARIRETLEDLALATVMQAPPETLVVPMTCCLCEMRNCNSCALKMKSDV